MWKNSYNIQLWPDEGNVVTKSDDNYDITGKEMKIFLEPGEYRKGYFYPFLKVKKKLTFNEDSKIFKICMIFDKKPKVISDELNSKNLMELVYDSHNGQARVTSNFCVSSSGEICEYDC